MTFRLIDGARCARAIPRGVRRRLKRPWQTLLRWEQQIRERRLYAAFVCSGDLVFDIGANEGMKSAAFLSLGARVVAVEPDPWCVRQLERRFYRQIASGRFTLLPAAIGREPGTILLRQFTERGRNASASESFLQSVASQMGQPVDSVIVKMIPTGVLLRQFGVPAFMKVDVEGMDADVLAGLPQRPTCLSFEFNLAPQLVASTEACIAEVIRLGFTQENFTEAANTTLLLSDWVHPRHLIEQVYRRTNGRTVWGDVVVR